jgi:hypothetical protein
MALFRALFPLFAALFILGWLVRAALPSPVLPRPVVVFLFLVLAGGCALFVTLSRGALASWIKGAAGEEKVAQALAFLPAGWDVFHGVPPSGHSFWPARADLDHVVLGPAGLFVVETKNWTGRIEVRDETILYEGGAPSRPPLAQVHRSAAELAARIKARCGVRAAVHPVLCFAGTPPETGDEVGVGDAIVCGVGSLNRVLLAWKDESVSASDRQKILAWLQSEMG